MKYIIVFSNESLNDLTEKVNEMIEGGYLPLGGISVTSYIFPGLGSNDATLVMAQAMMLTSEQSES